MSARARPALLAALLICAAAALMLSACGSDGDDEATAASPEEFVAQADVICEREDNAIAAEMEDRFGADRLGPGSQKEERAFVTEVVIPGIQAQVDGLRELEVPVDGRRQMDEFIAALQQGVDDAESDPLELTIYGDRPRKDPVFAEALDLATELGFDDCTEGEPDIPG
jgi:hypothetical protein